MAEVEILIGQICSQLSSPGIEDRKHFRG